MGAQLHGPSEMEDEELLRAVFDAADQVSAVATRVAELSLDLDRLIGAAAEGWAPAAYRRIEDDEDTLERWFEEGS